MEELINKVKEIKRIAKTSNPVIYDLARDTLHYLEYNKFYSHEEVLRLLDRKDGFELSHD